MLIKPTSGAVSMIQQDYDKNHECRLTIAEKKFYSRTQCISYPKNSPWLKPIDKEYINTSFSFFGYRHDLFDILMKLQITTHATSWVN